MNGKFILLVEDNPNDVELTIRAINKNKIKNQIIVAEDGEEAINFFEGNGKFKNRNINLLPEIILLDLKLPKLNGLEVLQKIKENNSTKFIPVIILTSSVEVNDIFQCYNKGANSYIQKPVNFENFLDVVKQIGIYWILLNESVQNRIYP